MSKHERIGKVVRTFENWSKSADYSSIVYLSHRDDASACGERVFLAEQMRSAVMCKQERIGKIPSAVVGYNAKNRS